MDVFEPSGQIDSGNPIFDIIWGITSFGEGRAECKDSNLPSVFTRLSSVLPWISDVVATVSDL